MKTLRIATITILLAALCGCITYQVQSAPCPMLCRRPVNEADIAALFDRWNTSLQTGDPRAVVANYAERSILLPTVSNRPRLTPAEKEDYFHHFLEKSPAGRIDLRHIDISGDMAVDSGLYTFTFAKTGEEVHGRYSFAYKWDGTQWLIISHHSSMMPEK